MTGERALFTCALLAGGESRRFGAAKPEARAPDGGWPLARVVDRLRAVGERCAIAGSPARAGAAAAALGLARIDDAEENSGPLGGLVAALAHGECGDPLLVLPCDMPRVPGDARALFTPALSPPVDAALLVFEGRPVAVCGLYRRRALPALRAALAARTLRLRDALAPLRLAYVTPAHGAAPLFRSFNTPEEFAALWSEPYAPH